jgi:glutamate N-acetyltransferase/amino-acid N-acetyltransferase
VDNTTSTSDSLLLFATGRGAAHRPIRAVTDAHFRGFRKSLEEVLRELSQSILEDARKDGKLFTVSVSGARSATAARRIAEAVSNSRLARRVVATGELYLGRIIAAIGSSTEQIDPDALAIRIGGTLVSKGGASVPENEAEAEAHLWGDEIRIEIDVAVGRGRATVASVVPNGWP